MIYATCPVCEEPTTRYTNLKPLSIEEAEQIKLRYEFERFYEKRCASLNIAADGPLPSDYEVPSA